MKIDRPLYRALGIKPDATLAQIKKAYKVLSKIHHPDKGGDVEQFKRIKEAYEVLKDPESRELYDRDGFAPKTTNSVEKLAVGLIMQHLQVWVQQLNLNVDPIRFVDDKIDQEIHRILTHVTNMEKAVKVCEEASKRAGCEDGQENFISDFLLVKKGEATKAIEDAKRQEVILEKASELIENFSWEDLTSLTYTTGATSTGGTVTFG